VNNRFFYNFAEKVAMWVKLNFFDVNIFLLKKFLLSQRINVE